MGNRETARFVCCCFCARRGFLMKENGIAIQPLLQGVFWERHTELGTGNPRPAAKALKTPFSRVGTQAPAHKQAAYRCQGWREPLLKGMATPPPRPPPHNQHLAFTATDSAILKALS